MCKALDSIPNTGKNIWKCIYMERCSEDEAKISSKAVYKT
jgi:hypothetical protein